MVLGIALVVSTISVIGFIKIKKSVTRVVFGILGTVSVLIVILVGSITYVMSYKVNAVDSSVSSDGKFKLLFQQIGDPDFPFGYTHARLALKDESGTIATYSFDVANDGGNVSAKSWQVTWGENCVEAVISGEEQNDIRYILYFDGKKDFNQLDSKYGKNNEAIESLENVDHPELGEEEEISTDENGYPFSDEYYDYKCELLEIAKMIGVDSNLEVKCYLTVKGYPYAVISCTSDKATGERIERHLIFNESYESTLEHEYVLEEYHYSSEGVKLSDPSIVDFYLIDCKTMEVTDEQTNVWH